VTSELIIWMGTDPNASWYWTAPEKILQKAMEKSSIASHEYLQGRVSTDEAKAELARREDKDVCVIIAGQSVRIVAHDLPKLSGKERLAAAGFAIEEDVAGMLSGQHIVLGDKDDARAAIITKVKMQEIIAALDKAGFTDVPIYADFDALSSARKALALEDRVIVAMPLGHTLDKAWHDPKNVAEIIPDSQNLAKFVNLEAAINLRQNSFSPRQSFAFSGTKIDIKSLGRLAALCVICGVSWLGFQAVSTHAKTQQTVYVKSETARIYSDATGRAAPPNPALAVTRTIQSRSTQNANFLSLSKLLFDAVSQTDGIIIETVQYDTSRSELSLRIIYPGFASTTELETTTLGLGGVFEAGGVREQGGQFIGDATLRLGGGS